MFGLEMRLLQLDEDEQEQARTDVYGRIRKRYVGYNYIAVLFKDRSHPRVRLPMCRDVIPHKGNMGRVIPINPSCILRQASFNANSNKNKPKVYLGVRHDESYSVPGLYASEEDTH